MGFPGGRVDADDADSLAAVLRECREELDLDLETLARLLGPLAHLPAVGRGRPQGMVIEPFVFFLADTPAFTLNHEVEETVWIPLDFFRNQDNRSTMPWQYDGVTLELPCYHYEGRVDLGPHPLHAGRFDVTVPEVCRGDHRRPAGCHSEHSQGRFGADEAS